MEILIQQLSVINNVFNNNDFKQAYSLILLFIILLLQAVFVLFVKKIERTSNSIHSIFNKSTHNKRFKMTFAKASALYTQRVANSVFRMVNSLLLMSGLVVYNNYLHLLVLSINIIRFYITLIHFNKN